MYLKRFTDYGLPKPKRILHIGANEGQEVTEYARHAIQGWHVEAIPEVFRLLQERCAATPSQHAINACLSDVAGEQVVFHVASNGGQSSSLLELGRHRAAYPSITYADSVAMVSSTVDELIASSQVPPDIDFCVIDTQGAEMLVLRGATALLAGGALTGLEVEVAVEPLYEGEAPYLEVCSYLREFGYHLRSVEFNVHGWADAWFLRKWWVDQAPTFDFLSSAGTNVALNAPYTQSSFYGRTRDTLHPRALTNGLREGQFSVHTDIEASPWIMLDLGEVADFDEVVIFNRVDFCRERASRLSVWIGETDQPQTELFRHDGVFGGIDGHPLRVKCPGSQARFVKIVLNDTNYLHLTSVELYRKG